MTAPAAQPGPEPQPRPEPQPAPITGRPGDVRVRGLCKTVAAWDADERGVMATLRHRVPALMQFGPQRPTLQDVSFEVAAGGALGVIGTNGAGKSTLLKLLAGLIRPASGSIEVHGTVRSILALGEAFDLSLPAAENAITSARVAGMSGRQARAALPKILEFAELSRFGTAPVRTFSEGMRLRLAMGVIAQLDGDVYLIDEVLAVGDAWFQMRCLEYFASQRRRGATMIFASHDLDRLAAASERILWLDQGRVRMLGEPVGVVAAYRQRLTHDSAALTPSELLGEPGRDGLPTRVGSGEVRIESISVRGGGDVMMPGHPLAVDVRIASSDGATHRCHVTVSLFNGIGVKVLDSTTDAARLQVRAGPEPLDVRLRLPQVPLASGEYRVEVGVYREDWHHGFDIRPEAAFLRLEGGLGEEGVAWAPADWTLSEAPREGSGDA